MATQRRLDETYMACARAVAALSHAERKKVGAILVSTGHGIIAEGYNGTYSGADNKCEEVRLEEVWKETKYPYHLVSNFGKVKRLAYESKFRSFPEVFLTLRINKKGYVEVKIGGIYKRVHVLVAEAFIANPSIKTHNQINHIDRNKNNNNVLNLEWCTNLYNCIDRSSVLDRGLPVGITAEKKGRNNYVSHIYREGKIISKRFVGLEEAIKFRSEFISDDELITFRYTPTECELKTKPEVLHAESNAIAKVAKSTNSSLGSTLYVTISPCFECAKQIIQAGIIRVVYEEEYRITSGIDLLYKAGIKVEKL